MTERVDAVVVGSGFGGSVAACRMAEQGHAVVLLERGRRYPPGSFARRPAELARAMWDPSEGLQGLFDFWSFRHLEAVVSSGLGGGSLIYANVLLRKDERWFVDDGAPSGGYESWPVTRADLDPCYDLAEEVLGARANPYPHADGTPKTVALRQAAKRLRLDWFRPPLAVSFAGKGQHPGDPIAGAEPNLHGAVRHTCQLCGECNFGCNFGSKNTLDYTYLSMADRAGADLRDRCEVRTVTPLPGGGFEVGYVRHEPENEGVRLDTSRLAVRTVRARVVVLAAGALGSTYLLLRNRDRLPALGPALGTRFSGNGDLLGFVRSSPDRLDPSSGPVITSTIRVPDALDGGEGRGFYLQDGGYPAFVDWLVETTGAAGTAKRVARAAVGRVLAGLSGAPNSRIGAEVGALFGAGQRAAGMLPLLGMGRDVPDGRLRLRGGWLDVDWCEATSRTYLDRLTATMAAVAEELGGELTMNPTRLLRRLITVHPLGGCPMAVDKRRGVVDDHGESFGHSGLFVADGSVLPGPVGANPGLTIAALAERFAGRMTERLGAGRRRPPTLEAVG
ncbi:MAG TPA: GMC oxidoreductase [Actinophytocola sp.]|uniref:GMC oxidoreductase n=1 Tax=Actinophytocola sp. TaxID=1872138 RepID=UPI002DB5E97A|nr:GMC oxidoreductase [Actinophytocola sp.]HEU5473504.1 GMC oxidoreductase [Actinophytocola sp.]